jgi:glutamine amidotransferase-like uncharacterized protein
VHRIIPALGLLACIGCRTHTRLAPILLFDGIGTSPGDVAAIESILHDNHFDYTAVNSRDLNSLTVPQLRACRLLIVPGGNFIHIGSNLTPQTSANIRTAVEGGLNYLGICAGAFLAGHLPQNSFNLTSGVRFPFYSVVNRGIMKTSVPITFPSVPAMDHYWESGPELSGWGEILARYPDGTPAVAQGAVGKGWVLLSGIHPEAPASWRRGLTFRTPAAEDNAYALTLIRAALEANPLPHF